MKKLLLTTLFMLLITSQAFADQTTQPNKYTQKLHNLTNMMNKSADDIDTKIDNQQKKNLERQKKYEAEKAARDLKIKQKEQERQAVYNQTQKRLEAKKEQLRKLLEE